MSYVAFIVLIMITMGIIMGLAVNRTHYHSLGKSLEHEAVLIREQLSNYDTVEQQQDFLQKVSSLGDGETETRITLIDSSGIVWADSVMDPAQIENYANRPEIGQALKGQTGTYVRENELSRQKTVYVAIPFEQGGVTGAIRLAQPLQPPQTYYFDLLQNLLLAIFLIGILAILIGMWVAAQISRPVSIITRAVDSMAQGNLQHRIHLLASDELYHLGKSINDLAETLENNLIEISSIKNRLELVLNNTVNGVITVSQYGRLTYINPIASDLLAIDTDQLGRKHTEVIENDSLLGLIDKVRKDFQPQRCEILFHGQRDRLLEVNAVPLRNGRHGWDEGTLVILNEITELKRLEQVRKDFVRNVSRELVTPVATIGDLAEKIINQPGLPDKHIQDARIIHDEATRLRRLICRLLELSRLESGRIQMHMQPWNMSDLIEKAIEIAYHDHKQKFFVDYRKPAQAPFITCDSELVIQVMLNLLDNAIKYSPPEAPIVVDIEEQPEEVKVLITNQGEGFPEQLGERLFERFYRLGEARPRESEGFGLGLSIVKHVIEHHNGQVGVISQPGQGVTFFFTLPKAEGFSQGQLPI